MDSMDASTWTARLLLRPLRTALPTLWEPSTQALECFQANFAVHVVFCVTGTLCCAIGLIASSDFLLIVWCVVPVYIGSLLARIYVARLRDTRRALRIFSLSWLAVTLHGCIAFVLLNNVYHFCRDLQLLPTVILAVLSAVVPVYLHLTGIPLGYRVLNNTSIWAAYALSPRWSVIPHRQALLLMVMVMIAGDAIGFQASRVLYAAIQPAAKPAVDKDADMYGGTKAERSLTVAESAPQAHRGAAADAESRVPGAAMDLLRVKMGEISILPLTLRFTPDAVEAAYSSRVHSDSLALHSALCSVSVVLCALAVGTDPDEQVFGRLAFTFFVLLLFVRALLHGSSRSPQAALTLFGQLWVGATAVLSILCTVAYVQLRPNIPDRGVVATAASSILIALQPLHMRLVALHFEHVLAAQLCVVLPVFCLRLVSAGAYTPFPLTAVLRRLTAGNAEPLAPDLVSFWVPLAVLCSSLIGELLSRSVDFPRRVSHVRRLERERLAAMKAEAIAREEKARVQQMERERRADAAKRQADSRLNHVIKGHCGTSVSSLDMFMRKLPYYLARPLPPEVLRLLTSPVSQMNNVIQWCHRRQMLIQQEEGTYVSTRSPTDVALVLESAMADAGKVKIEQGSEYVQVDEGVLRLVSEEALINSRKHGVAGTIVATAALDAGMLRVVVCNANAAGASGRAPTLCEDALLPEKGPSTRRGSAMSDGLGLPSIVKAIEQAHGAVQLRIVHIDGIPHTQLTFSLPAEPCEAPELHGPGSPGTTHATWLASRPACSCGRGGSKTGVDMQPARAESTIRTECALCNGSHDDELTCSPGGRAEGAGLFCLGLDDEWVPRMLHCIFFSDYLKADMNPSGSLRDTEAERDAFVEVALGLLDLDLKERHDAARGRHPDVVPLDVCVETHSGLETARKLRERGFGGIVCLLTGKSESELEATPAMDAVDITFAKGSSPEYVAEKIRSQLKRKLSTTSTPTLAERETGSSGCLTTETAPSACSGPLACVALDDEELPRMVLNILIKDFLSADMEHSCVVGSTVEEQEAFVDIGLGLLDEQLQPLDPPRTVDVVLVDQNISDGASGPTQGLTLVQDLRKRGFKGVTCLFTGESAEEIEMLRSEPSVDLVLEKGLPLPTAAGMIRLAVSKQRASRAKH